MSATTFAHFEFSFTWQVTLAFARLPVSLSHFWSAWPRWLFFSKRSCARWINHVDVHELGAFMQQSALLQLNVWMSHVVPAFQDAQATGRRCGVFTASVFFPLSCSVSCLPPGLDKV